MKGHWSLKTTLQLLQLQLIIMMYLCSICVLCEYHFIIYMLCCFIMWACHIDEGHWSFKTTITGKLYKCLTRVKYQYGDCRIIGQRKESYSQNIGISDGFECYSICHIRGIQYFPYAIFLFDEGHWLLKTTITGK